MTIHLAPIEAESAFHYNDHRYSHHVRVFQMYAHRSSGGNEKVVKKSTHWVGKSYSSEAALVRDLNDPELLTYLLDDLSKDALDQHFKGLKVVRTVVAFGPRWEEGYAIDTLDARHLRCAYKHHKSFPKPGTGTKPHLAWNVTKHESWGSRLDAAFMERMQNLRYRSKHLEHLPYEKEAVIAEDFAKVAPVWISRGVGDKTDHVGEFFLTLMQRKHYDAHRECLDIWGSLIMQEPEKLHTHWRVGLANDHKLVRGDVNPTINALDHFETINTLFAMFPDTCLAGDELLSGEWLSGLKHEEFRDAGMVALMAGYARYQKKVCKYEYLKASKASEQWPTEEGICQEFFRKVAASAGVSLDKLLDCMAPFTEGGSKVVNRYFSDMTVASHVGMGYNKYPQPLGYTASKEMSLRLVPQALDVLLTAKLMAHPNESGYYVSQVEQDQDRLYFRRLIAHPRITADQLRNMIPYDRFNEDDIEAMADRDPQLATDYLSKISDDEAKAQIAKGNIPVRFIKKRAHLDHQFSTDLGL